MQGNGLLPPGLTAERVRELLGTPPPQTPEEKQQRPENLFTRHRNHDHRARVLAALKRRPGKWLTAAQIQPDCEPLNTIRIGQHLVILKRQYPNLKQRYNGTVRLWCWQPEQHHA